MNHPADELLRKILKSSEPARNISQNPVDDSVHPDEETLALFVAGGLSEAELAQLVKHIADCPNCRAVVSHALLADAEIHENDAIETNVAHRSDKTAAASQSGLRLRRQISTVVAAAAMLLIAIGIWMRNKPPQVPTDAQDQLFAQASKLLQEGKFTEVDSLIDQAQAEGKLSDQLLNLKSQAARRIPSTIAVATFGRLTQFGVAVDGTIARGAEPQTGLKEAGDLLQQLTDPSTDLLLNRGHWALSAGETERALADFTAVTQQEPDEKWGWLGLGLAQFLNHDYDSAEGSFRVVLNLDGGDSSAKINLALTLQELDRNTEALAIWKLLSSEPLNDDDRQLVDEAISLLNDSN